MNLRRLLPTAAALLLIGCGAAPESIRPGLLTAEDLALRLQRIGAMEGHFTAEGSITVSSPTMEQSAGFDLAVRGRDSVRLDVFGPFGIPVGSALFTRDSFTAYNALNNTLYKGSPERSLRMLPFVGEIPFELLLGTLRGIHPGTDGTPDSLRQNDEGQFIYSVRRSNGWYDVLRFDPRLDRIVRCSRRDAYGGDVWSIAYRYEKNDSTDAVPRQVEVRFPAKDARLVIEYDDVRTAADDAPLTIDVPDDATVITVE